MFTTNYSIILRAYPLVRTGNNLRRMYTLVNTYIKKPYKERNSVPVSKTANNRVGSCRRRRTKNAYKRNKKNDK